METSEAFGLYVHWPFCLSKCPYCDFNSHVAGQVDHGRWAKALVAELGHMATLMPHAEVTSVFFGGGTPSLMAPSTVAAVLEAAAGHWDLAPDAEITLEANPTSVEAAKFEGFRAAGVNRISIGVQSLDDRALRFLGRTHSADEALSAVRLARRLFERVSFDLIYARPGQTMEAWRGELERALEEGCDHLSLYQLTIEPETAFARWQKEGRLALPVPDKAARLYQVTGEVTERFALRAYEVSNYARPGAESRHNLVYWRGQPYAGIGPGAHGRLPIDKRRHATSTEKRPDRWLERVERDGHGLLERTPLSSVEQAEELMLMGLRLEEGVPLSRYEALAGALSDPDRLGALEAEGLVSVEDGSLKATPAGRLVLNAVLRELLA